MNIPRDGIPVPLTPSPVMARGINLAPRDHQRSGAVRVPLILSLTILIVSVVAYGLAASTEQPPQNRTLPGDAAPERGAPKSTNLANPAAEAQRLMQQAHLQLMNRRSIRAEIAEVAALTTPPLRMTGTYVSSGIKLRLDYRVELPGNVEGSLLEVCDGERLWSVMTLPGSQRVTRRDVRQILAAAERTASHPHSSAVVDLALGGLPAVLSSLQQSIDFQRVESTQHDDQQVFILSGRWKSDLAETLGGSAKTPRFPEYLPDSVRLTLAADSLFPIRLVYLKQREAGVQPLLDLRFRRIEFDVPIDDRAFAFTPPDSTEPEDITREYLQRLAPTPTENRE